MTCVFWEKYAGDHPKTTMGLKMSLDLFLPPMSGCGVAPIWRVRSNVAGGTGDTRVPILGHAIRGFTTNSTTLGY